MGNYLGLAEYKTALLCIADFERISASKNASAEPFDDVLVDATVNVSSVPLAHERLGTNDVAYFVACKKATELAKKEKNSKFRRREHNSAHAFSHTVIKEYFRLKGIVRP
jgi:hypothetical protein